MDRIVIIGCSAGGKSTIARELRRILGIDVVHLDSVLWKPGCQLSDPREERAVVAELIEKPRWIIDGNYTESLPMRLERADTVVWIDFSRLRCLMRALKRLFQFRGTTRPDMGANCPEELNFDFLRWIWRFPHTERLELVRHLQEHATHAEIMHLRRPRELERWLDEVRRQAQVPKEEHASRAH